MAMDKQIRQFCAVQKDPNGIDMLVETGKVRMGRYQAVPDTLIIAQETSLYVSMVPETKQIYNLGGPPAIAKYEAGPAGFEARTFRDLKVHVNTPYDAGDNQDAQQLLNRTIQVGEYYVMSPPAMWNKDKKLPSTYMGAPANQCRTPIPHTHFIPFSHAPFVSHPRRHPGL